MFTNPIESTNDDDDDEEFQLPPLSKLEQTYLSQARIRQKNNRIKPQICLGKEFKGDAFIPSPKIILFQDFSKGKIYKKKITLTNVSYTFNGFKLLPLNDNIRNFFEIRYKLPGKMSAGTTCDINIQFSPQIENDIEDFLYVLSETGEIKIPLKCFTKKVVMTCIPKDQIINFGNVVKAENKKLSITLNNQGALNTRYKIIGELIDKYSYRNVKDKTVEKMFHVIRKAGDILKHSNVTLNFTFSPQTEDEIKTYFIIQFDDDYTNDMKFNVYAKGTQVSIYLKQEIIDFQWIYFDTLYRASLYIYNRGNNAIKCNFKVPKILKDHLEFIPTVGFVQTDKPFELQVKFRPKRDIYEKCKQYFRAKDKKFNIPIRIYIPSQTMPVYFSLQAYICDSKIELNPNFIDFGKCSVEESISIPVKIKNHSDLVQELGFMFLPKYIEVKPNDGFFSILPKETIVVNVIFTPKAQVEYHFRLVCKTDRNEEYIISCTADGVRPLLKFSHNSIKFKSIAIGNSILQTIQLINVSKSLKEFKFESPKDSGIVIRPSQGRIENNGRTSIIVRFTPKKQFSLPEIKNDEQKKEEIIIEEEEDKKNKKNKKKKKKLKKSPKGSGKKEDKEKLKKEEEEKVVEKVEEIKPIDNYLSWEKNSVDEKQWARFKKWSIPCYIKDYQLRAICLDIQTTVVLPGLVIENEKGETIEGIDFGETPQYKNVSKSFYLHNTTKNVTTEEIYIQSMEYSIFSINKMPVPLKPGERCEIIINFCPEEVCKYKWLLHVFSKEINNLVIRLKGEGQKPSLTISPEFEDEFLLDIGDILFGNKIIKPFVVKNEGILSVPLNIEFENVNPYNYNGTTPFYAIPSKCEVLPNDEVKIDLCFKPDHQYSNYRTTCIFDYGGKDHRKIVNIIGRSWNPGLFVVFDTEKSKDIVIPNEDLEDPFRILIKENSSEYEKSFDNVTFGKSESFIFQIGNTKGPKGEFYFENLKERDKVNGFSIEPMKSVVDSSQKKDIVIKFTPTKSTLSLIPVKGVDIDILVESTFKCHLKDLNGDREVTILVRGSVNREELEKK